MNAIEQTYVSLLADVALASGFSEIRGSWYGLQWCLKEAPKLEKHLLSVLECQSNLDLELFPVELRRLAQASLVDGLKLRLMRQLLLFCYKASVPHDKQTTELAFRTFLETNHQVGKYGNGLSGQSPALLNLARRHVQSVLFQAKWKGENFSPSHGPGAVTTKKSRWTKWYNTIESIYPYSDFMSLYQNRPMLEELDDASREDIIEAKVIAVPKDSRGPRLICVHPAEAVWIQQGVRRVLERAITRVRHAKGPWPHGHVFFDDQSVNGRIALLSSKSRHYATIDMKEASDRISEPLVQILFGDHYKYFGCCRAQKFVIPRLGSYQNLSGHLASYAPMGNATTFPVQSLVFWAICVASMQYRGFHQPGAVFVFGDDIIVPSKEAPAIMADLESFGLLCNTTKSFYRGAFRESCGVDAFNGVDVTPVRWKTTVNAEHATGLQSLSDLAMRLRVAGYENAAASCYEIIRARLRRCGNRLFFTNNPDHGGIAEFTTNAYNVWSDSYWNRHQHYWSSRVYRLEEVGNSPEPQHWNAVLESVTSLERAGQAMVPDRCVSRRTRLNRGWTPVM